MDYEKRYNEALEDMRVVYPNLKGDAKLAVEHAFPELAESEDERIRRELIEYLRGDLDDITTDDTDRWITWIEKKKETHFTKRNALFDKCVENCDPEIMKRVSDEVDAMLEKEQKPVQNPKKGCPTYPLSVVGDLLAKTPQEPIEFVPEQKPAEKQDYSGLDDLERAIHRGFLAAGIENVPVGIIKETAQECLAKMPNTEWSEEDEAMRDNILRVLSCFVGAVECESNPSLSSLYPNYLREINWLKSLHPQPKQEWSEEDERVLKGIIGLIEHEQHYGVSNKEMLDWLKSLRPSWKPSEEQMDALLDALRVSLCEPDMRMPYESLSVLYEQIKNCNIWNNQPQTF